MSDTDVALSDAGRPVPLFAKDTVHAPIGFELANSMDFMGAGSSLNFELITRAMPATPVEKPGAFTSIENSARGNLFPIFSGTETEIDRPSNRGE